MLFQLNKKTRAQVKELIHSATGRVSIGIHQESRKMEEFAASDGTIKGGIYLFSIEKMVLDKINEFIDTTVTQLDSYQLNKGHIFTKIEWDEIEMQLNRSCDNLLSTGKRIQSEATEKYNHDSLRSIVQSGCFNGAIKTKLNQIKGNNDLVIKTMKNELLIKRLELLYKFSAIIGVIALIVLAWKNAVLFKEVTTFLREIK